ncbi:MAG: hydrogenase maturation nickel metallochaperone HypA [Cyanobacteria bacterium P01_H01_bin.121]
MHELGITQNIVAIAAEHAQGAKVQRITLEIGQLSAIMADAIQFCFDVCAQGTVLEGAILEIIQVSGLGRCQQCGQDVPLKEPFGICECGSTNLQIIQGQELNIREMELEALCA